MKRIIGLAMLKLLLFIPVFCGAVVTGKLDLGLPPQGFVMRDIKNGQWRGGYSKALWELDLNGNQLFYVGYNQTWNAQHGNSALGGGIGTKQSISQIASMGAALAGISATPPPFVQYFGNILSIEANGAYMPVHTADVNGPFIYGFGFQVDLSDVFGILQKGL
jgi:hypothetical protein